jgi:acyl-CoA dehydrogenase
MVDFNLTPEQQELVKMAEKFAKTEIAPVAPKYDHVGEFPQDILQKTFELGLMNTSIPNEFGGLGLGLFDLALIVEEFAVACPGIAIVVFNNELALAPIVKFGTQEQKERFLPQFTQSPKLASFALTEHGAGSDISSIATTAKIEGDHYVLNGTKWFITNAPQASLHVVVATHDPALKQKGLSAFIVEKDFEGVLIGKSIEKLGTRASTASEIILNNVKVPASNLLGAEMDGFNVALASIDRTKVVVAAFGLGVARSALQNSLSYSLQREQFGKPIGEFQAIQFKLADMAKDLEAARLLTWLAAWRYDQGLPSTKEASMAKALATDVAMKASVEAVQVYGGYGYIKEFPVEKMMRDAKVLQILEGTNEIHRLVIARELIRSVKGY